MRWSLSFVLGLLGVALSCTAASADEVKIPGSFFDLAGQAGLPAYLKCDQATRGGPAGLRGGQLETDDTDFFEKDFTLDLIFDMGDEDRRKKFAVGIGENGHEGGWLLNSIQCSIGGPPGKAEAAVTYHHESKTQKVGNINSDGLHLLRMQKVGNAITFSILDKYKGQDPDQVKFTQSSTEPAFKEKTPFLNDANSKLYITGDIDWRAIRLQVGGKTVDAGKRADADLKPVADDVPFYALGATSHVPGFMARPATEAENHSPFTAGGWDMRQIFRSRQHDYLKKDFTLDLVVKMPARERNSFIVGVGENGRAGGNWILNSACATMEGPSGDGRLFTTFHDLGGPGMVEWGKLGKDWSGVNLVRMQHHGDILTFFVSTEFDGTFKPDYMVVMPAMHLQAKYLTAKNGYIFFGDHGIVQKMRLVVDGTSVDPNVPGANDVEEVAKSSDEPATDTPAAKPARTPGSRRATATPPAAAGRGSTSTKAPADIPPPPDNRPKLAMESDKHQITQGLGQTLLLLEKDQVRRLGGDGFTVKETIKLPGPYSLIAERKDYFVAVSDESKSLDLIDKKTLKVTKSIQMDYHQRWDLCLSPFKPVCYVTVQKTNGDGFENDIMIVDESTGDVREPDGFRGKYLKISPDGRILYAAYNEMIMTGGYKNGAPDYIDIDILYVYDVTGRDPLILTQKDDAGANCFGIAVSPDGRRVSYLSFVGYPLYSKNIAVWDPADFTKRPLAFPTRDNKADCRHLAFHPELPFAAAAADDGAVCFDSATGQVQKDRLEIPFAFDGTKVNNLIFSPDGTNLLLDCEQNGDHFLVRIKVKLSAEEAATAKKGPPVAHPPAGKTPAGGGTSA